MCCITALLTFLEHLQAAQKYPACNAALRHTDLDGINGKHDRFLKPILTGLFEILDVLEGPIDAKFYTDIDI